MGHLSQEQKDMFIKDGFIIVRDLCPDFRTFSPRPQRIDQPK